MEQLSAVNRILFTFTKPSTAMKDIGEHPSFAVPIVSMIVFPLLSVILNMGYYQNQFYTIMQAQALQMSEMGVTINVASMVQMQLYVLLGTTLVSSLISWILFSLVVYLLSMMFEGHGEIGYKTVLSVTGYAFLIKVIYHICVTVNIMVYPDKLLTFSLYDIFGGSVENIFLIIIMQLLSVFRIWEYAVVALGISATKQISKSKGFLIMGLVLALSFALSCVQQVVLTSTMAAIA